MALRDFRTSLHGELILPDDGGYDSARRGWNGMIDKYPALIIRCANRADVTHAVEFARLQHLPVAVRGGGHSVSGKSVCDGGIVIDLSHQNIRPTGGMTRAIFVIDRNDHTTYNEYVADQLREPDYAAALQAIQRAS